MYNRAVLAYGINKKVSLVWYGPKIVFSYKLFSNFLDITLRLNYGRGSINSDTLFLYFSLAEESARKSGLVIMWAKGITMYEPVTFTETIFYTKPFLTKILVQFPRC